MSPFKFLNMALNSFDNIFRSECMISEILNIMVQSSNRTVRIMSIFQET